MPAHTTTSTSSTVLSLAAKGLRSGRSLFRAINKEWNTFLDTPFTDMAALATAPLGRALYSGFLSASLALQARQEQKKIVRMHELNEALAPHLARAKQNEPNLAFYEKSTADQITHHLDVVDDDALTHHRTITLTPQGFVLVGFNTGRSNKPVRLPLSKNGLHGVINRLNQTFPQPIREPVFEPPKGPDSVPFADTQPEPKPQPRVARRRVKPNNPSTPDQDIKATSAREAAVLARLSALQQRLPSLKIERERLPNGNLVLRTNLNTVHQKPLRFDIDAKTDVITASGGALPDKQTLHRPDDVFRVMLRDVDDLGLASAQHVHLKTTTQILHGRFPDFIAETAQTSDGTALILTNLHTPKSKRPISLSISPDGTITIPGAESSLSQDKASALLTKAALTQFEPKHNKEMTSIQANPRAFEHTVVDSTLDWATATTLPPDTLPAEDTLAQPSLAPTTASKAALLAVQSALSPAQRFESHLRGLACSTSFNVNRMAVEGGTLLRTSLPGSKPKSKVTAIVFDDGTVTVCGLGKAGAMGDLTPAQALQKIGSHAAKNSQMTLPVLKEIVTTDGATPPRIKQPVYG